MYTLGVDIGTFESKGVLADHAGNIIAADRGEIGAVDRGRAAPI